MDMPSQKDSNVEPSAPRTARAAQSQAPLVMWGIFIVLSGFTLYFARAIFVPITLAIVLALLLAPLVKGLRKLYVPASLGALLVVAGMCTAIAASAYGLSRPAVDWVDRAPQIFPKLEKHLKKLRRPVREMTQATSRVERIAEVSPERGTMQVRLRGPSLVEALVDRTTEMVVGAISIIILLYFLLATPDLFLTKLVRILPKLSAKKSAVRASRQIARDVSRYLGIVTLINLGVGIATAMAMVVFKMPNPILWGVAATILNFIPYVGAFVTMTILGGVGLFVFDDFARALMIVASFLLITTIEAYVVTPLALSRKLSLNPFVVLVGLIFWGFIWGIAGALLAVPILVLFKSLCDHMRGLKAIATFISA